MMTSKEDLQAIFDGQCAAHAKHPFPSTKERIETLDKLAALLKRHIDPICQAISQDFHQRPSSTTKLVDVLPSLNAIKHNKRHLRRWMKPQRRKRTLLMPLFKSSVVPQPLGVVGIVVPWNYPLILAMVPLADALAAGNRVMIKISESTPEYGKLLQKLFSETFNNTQIAIVNGDLSIARAFSALPFNHILATGSSVVGKAIMQEASHNLTPVTLELGGKSPSIITTSNKLSGVAEKINSSKLLNAGQTCIATDYILVPKILEQTLITELVQNAKHHYPSYHDSKDYTHIINDKQFQRLTEVYKDALDKGANAIQFSDETDNPSTRCMIPKILTHLDESMRIMQEEIFGPLLPIIPYESIDDAINYINAKPKPLTIYLFSNDKNIINEVNQRTLSGALIINTTMMHAGQDNLPFGGVGASGMGHYHGHDGFLTFSKLKPVAQFSGPFISLLPPYNGLIKYIIKKFTT